MRDQRGATLIEMIIVVAIIGITSGFATLAGVGYLNSTKISNGASQLADSVSLAREQAIARYERWRIRFVTTGGSSVATQYLLESCTVPVGSSDAGCTGAWVAKRTVQTESGTGILLPTYGGVLVTELTFNRVGHFTNPTDVTLRVCRTQATGGVLGCQPGSAGRIVKLRAFSGIIET